MVLYYRASTAAADRKMARKYWTALSLSFRRVRLAPSRSLHDPLAVMSASHDATSSLFMFFGKIFGVQATHASPPPGDFRAVFPFPSLPYFFYPRPPISPLILSLYPTCSCRRVGKSLIAANRKSSGSPRSRLFDSCPDAQETPKKMLEHPRNKVTMR